MRGRYAERASAFAAELAGEPDNDEFTNAYLIAGLVCSQLAIVDAIDNLSQTVIDKFPDRI